MGRTDERCKNASLYLQVVRHMDLDIFSQHVIFLKCFRFSLQHLTAVISSMVHFEITDQKISRFFLLVADGRTRKADERAITFMNKYAGDKVYILDAKELGLNNLKDSVAEYFNHLLFTPILNNVYMKALSKQQELITQHVDTCGK